MYKVKKTLKKIKYYIIDNMNSKAEAIEWAKTLPDAVKTHESFRQAFSKKF
jgi:hypothetical protein